MQDKLEVTVNGVSRDFLMSFGLLNELSGIVEDPSRITQVSLDITMRTKFLLAILAERKKSGKIIKAIEDIGDVEISTDDVEKILDWACEHVMSFFVRSVQRAVNVTNKHQGPLKALASSLTGSDPSVSETA